ncbi:MAG: hypothetical protein OXH52_15190 [Gammaproteobacteria bacterium]|nr:hypothetical protein [Gammaproteobacteria bacterium]
MPEQHTTADEAAALLQKAQAALNRGDVVDMLTALAASGFLDGLTRRLQAEWGGSLPAADIDECIAQAVDAAWAAARRGRTVANIGAWLWKVARNIANDKWHDDYALRGNLDDTTLSVDSDLDEPERHVREQIQDAQRREAIRIARELLPRLGEGLVVDVMEVVVDAVEAGVPDLPAASIGEAVGISAHTARTLVSRGLTRLRRLAEREGYEMPTDLPEPNNDLDEQE